VFGLCLACVWFVFGLWLCLVCVWLVFVFVFYERRHE
jgi:hypothetical protein